MRLLRYAAAPVLSLLLLAALGAEQLTRPRAADAADYHARVRLAVGAVPAAVGPWISSDSPIPLGAQALLQPNAVLSRTYVNTETHERMELLLVQCRDARDMGTHYPPVCYPNQGWTCGQKAVLQLRLGTRSVPLTEYDFAIDRFGEPDRLLVYNLMLLPDGNLAADINQVQAAAADYTQHFFGAAQLQFVFVGDSIPRPRRLRIVQEFLSSLSQTLNAVGSGVKHE